MQTISRWIKIAAIVACVYGWNSTTAHAQVTKIPLTPSMVTNEVAQGDAGMLVDEQGIAGDPSANSGGHPTTKWFPGWSSWYYPASAVIDLGTTYNITQIYLYDDTGTGDVTISTGQPFTWTALFTDPQTSYQHWNGHTVSIQTRYVRVSLAGAGAIPTEIVLYGTALGTPSPPPDPVPNALTPMDKFVGLNAFIDDPIGLMQVAGHVREYHSWSWDEGNGANTYPGYPGNLNKFSPSYVGSWDFDLYYGNLATLGVTPAPCLQGSVPWMTSGGADKPITSAADPTLPQSYVVHADHLFQEVARYGSTTVADGLLKLAPDQQRLSGLNKVSYFENWNEEDKWWEGRSAYFAPFEFAAMCSADYDGHLGTMGPTVGVKKADSQARLVMGGLAEASVDYLKAMKLWSDFNRGGSVPFDVINVHHYSTDSGGQGGTATTGISPEADHLKDKMAAIVDYRNRYLRGKEVWVSEFGYDTDPRSPFHAPTIGSFTGEQVQAQWIIRSYLALAAAGIDRAQVFMLRDVDSSDGGQFSTSGLTSSQSTGYQPKASWYYVYTLKNRLTGMTFDGEIPSGNPNVTIYRFKSTTSSAAAYALWCPTSNATIVANYALTLGTGETNAALVNFVKGNREGQVTNLAITNNQVKVNVSETPILVLTANSTPMPQPYHLDTRLTLAPSMIVNESGLGDPTLLVDEQNRVGDPSVGAGGAPTTQWFAGWTASAYPVSAYIDLGSTYTLTQIHLRDTSGTGNVTISTGTPGHWTSLFTDGLNNYMAWNAHAVNTQTRYLRVTLGSPSANLSEIAVYAQVPVLPDAVSSLQSTALSSSQIKLTWNIASNATSYNIFRSSSLGTYHTYIGSSSTPSFTNTGLAAGTAYYYIVVAANSDGSGPKSPEVTGTTQIALPTAPTNLIATGVSSSQINLTWNAVSGATSYNIFRSNAAATYHAIVGTSVTNNFSNIGLTASTTYYYIVIAINSAGQGAKSAEVAGTTLLGVPAAPTNVIATGISASQIKLTWNTISGATSYNIFRSSSAGTYHSYISSVTTPSFTNSGLTANTIYYYIIVAVNSVGSGAKSSEISGMTLTP